MCKTVFTNDGQELDTRKALARWLGVRQDALPIATGYAAHESKLRGDDCLCTVDLAAIDRIEHDGCVDYREAPTPPTGAP